MNLKGTKTEQNLQTAFAGESQARNKYTFYASQAKKEGFEQIAALFTETANNEKEHAKMWFKLLNGGIGKTVDNLKDAAAGENYEWTDMYATFAKEASCPLWRTARSSQRTASGSGSAATADTSTLERKHRRFVRSAHIQRHTLS